LSELTALQRAMALKCLGDDFLLIDEPYPNAMSTAKRNFEKKPMISMDD
jgi:hypothetical protein